MVEEFRSASSGGRSRSVGIQGPRMIDVDAAIQQQELHRAYPWFPPGVARLSCCPRGPSLRVDCASQNEEGLPTNHQ